MVSVPASQGSKALAKALGVFEEMVGGREGLAAALALIPLNEKEETLLGLLEDPVRVRDSVLALCQEAGVAGHTLMGLYRTAMTQQAEHILYGGLPAVVRGVVEQAVEGRAKCPDCGGDLDLGRAKCKTCNGVGYVWREANLAHQELAMDAAKMLPKSGGVNVQVDQRVGVMSGGGVFDKFVQMTDAAAYAIDGVVGKDTDGIESRRLDTRENQGFEGETQPEQQGDRGAVGLERENSQILPAGVENRRSGVRTERIAGEEDLDSAGE